MKASTAIRLQAAASAYVDAQQACPHWDFESDGDAAHDCCTALATTKEELRKARKAARKEKEKCR